MESGEAILREYIRRLDRMSEESFNDRAYPNYVKYINVFLKHFGGERLILVGSTTERLKLRWSKEGGDSDFLLVSGKLEVSVDQLEFRDDTPCFVWVRAGTGGQGADIGLVDDKYLPADMLRQVSPELFTIMRGIYLLFTNNTSYTPRSDHVTTHIARSKVGLAVSQYCDFKIDGRSLCSDTTLPKTEVMHRDEAFKEYLDKRKAQCVFREDDLLSLRQTLEFVSFIKVPGSVGAGLGYWEHFAYICSLVLGRFDSLYKSHPCSDAITVGVKDSFDDDEGMAEHFVNDFDSLDVNCVVSEPSGNESTNCKRKSGKLIRATYSEKTSKDFVPAVRLVGRLLCMETWGQETHRWLSPGQVEAVVNTDVFLVARFAPVNPSRKDFCLAFTLAENKLCECLSPAQRHVLVVMKAYLKGFLANKHQAMDRELRLTTFHMKTVVFHVCDMTEPDIWTENNLLVCIVMVLTYLQDTLMKEDLRHYFIHSNLYAAFEPDDFSTLLDCTRDILSDPVGHIQHFIDLDDGVPNEVSLTEEEVEELEKLAKDGGVSREVDSLEEALVDILRGLNDGPRDPEGKAPIRQALADTIQLYFKTEVERGLRRAAGRWGSGNEAGLAELVPFLTESIGAALVRQDNSSPLGDLVRVFEPFSSEEEKQKTFDSLKYLVVTHFSRDGE